MFDFSQGLGDEVYYSHRFIYAVFHTSPSLLSLSSCTPSSYSFPSLISSALHLSGTWCGVHFVIFTGFTVYHSSSVTFFPLSLVFFYTDVIKSSENVTQKQSWYYRFEVFTTRVTNTMGSGTIIVQSPIVQYFGSDPIRELRWSEVCVWAHLWGSSVISRNSHVSSWSPESTIEETDSCPVRKGRRRNPDLDLYVTTFVRACPLDRFHLLQHGNAKRDSIYYKTR